ncbi:hypothetical protein BCR34DRAFT_669540 [Clohesyomyces aquaticus]|uniref:Rhodopsin domain-containing protein n=1 Tax=Clohesyomyces aquaticus TaxID=1231657 RepID=A0A1Y1YAP8_9PLEO|nr:hypothetical protein BCR34DRAFT_669540 [Clohesyomyces aquaticus]
MTAEQRQKILEAPALKAPPGVAPNYLNPPNIRHEFIGIYWCLLALSTSMVLIRLYTKLRIVHRVVLEDYLILLSWGIFAIAYSIIGVNCANLPYGVHQYDMKVKQLITALHTYHWGAIFYSPIILPLKVAIGLQSLRVFTPPGSRDFVFWASHVLIYANIVFYIIEELLAIFSCQPRAKAWDPTIQGGHCLNHVLTNVTTAAANTLSDLLLLVIPHRVIWSLNMPKTQKMGLSAVFSVAILACAASTVRMYYAILLSTRKDSTYYVAMVGLWGMPEITCGYLVACLPVVPKFVKVMRKHPFFTRLSSGIRSSFWSTNTGPQNSDPGSKGHVRGRTDHKSHLKMGEIGVVTDIEFHELVIRDQSTDPQLDIEEGGDHGGGESTEEFKKSEGRYAV